MSNDKPKPTGAGKGSKPRPVDGNKYRENWELIFRKKKNEKSK